MVITKKLRTISNTDWIMEDGDEELDDAESEVEGQSDYIDTASRWFEGLIHKDVGITKEVYSIHNVEFDRQTFKFERSSASPLSKIDTRMLTVIWNASPKRDSKMNIFWCRIHKANTSVKVLITIGRHLFNGVNHTWPTPLNKIWSANSNRDKKSLILDLLLPWSTTRGIYTHREKLEVEKLLHLLDNINRNLE
ncbi:hypothetical protein Syun_021003 [Stephania yunnanensis]|uniref:Uncharacterized protein n=1 Tax=Stephania yunnanensis TaxID=152371 RepID=A0AAP0NRX1_9MAGN